MTDITLMMTNALALATVAMQIGIVAIIVAFLFPRASWSRLLLGFVRRHALILGCIIAFGAIAGSLYYSDIVGFEPCSLCWWQRIFIYPQAVIFGLAFWRRDRGACLYTLALSGIGSIISLYHTYIQYGGSPLFECGVSAASCAQRFVFVFDYVTIPLMALTTLISLALVSAVGLRKE